MWYKRNFLFVLSMCILSMNLLFAGEIHNLIQKSDIKGVKNMIKKDQSLIFEKNEQGLDALNLAAAEGNLKLVKYLLKKGADINTGDNEGSNPIHNAAIKGHYDVVKYLVKKGADVTRKDNNGVTPLHFAAYGKNEELAGFLIVNGADVNAKSNVGHNPLYNAVMMNNTEMAEFLIVQGSDVNCKAERGLSIIHYAAFNGNTPLVEFLLKRGADVEAKTDFAMTPFLMAVRHNHFDTAKLLLEKGADPKVADRNGRNALEYAVNAGYEMTKLAFDNGLELKEKDTCANGECGVKENTILHNAVFSNNAEVIELLIKKGADLNRVNENGYTALHMAVREDANETAEVLLKYGAETNTSLVITKSTPLHMAAMKGNYELVNLLLEKGADIKAKDKYGFTPLYYAKYLNYAQTSDILEKNGGQAQPCKNELCINDEILKDEAAVWYLGHSGWAVKSGKNLLIFDYWSPKNIFEEASLNNGVVNLDEIKDMDVYVFASHAHQDHYDPKIWEWKDKCKSINYVLGFTPRDIDIRDYTFLAPRKEKTIGDVSVKTIYSNDSGVGFLVSVNGIILFHAGDHANRTRDLSGDYVPEIDYIKDMDLSIDMAFLPVSGCNFGDQVAVRLGDFYTIKNLKPEIIFPMHAITNEFRYEEFEELAKEENLSGDIKCAKVRGDRFLYKKNKGIVLK